MDHLDHADHSYRLLCPNERYEKEKDGKVITISGRIHHIMNSSYFISEAEEEKCDPNLHSLLCKNRKESSEVYATYRCCACGQKLLGETYYVCSYCDLNYHNECVESPSVFHSSDHPKHPLQLVSIPGMFFFEHDKRCFSCRHRHCELFYYCSICDFSLHPVCARSPTSLTVDSPKRHKHTLHYFPRNSGLVCDVCALVDGSDYSYVCLLCDFFVHKRCLDLPYVIKVSRHDHRLAFTPTLPYKEPTKTTDCGVCHATINENYGGYSCTREGCVYALHSRCAMQSDVCDRKELEGEPEEVYEDTKMFEEKGDGVIQHRSHPLHLLRLENISHHESKPCQACRLPSNYCGHGHGDVYRCLQCDDFILHKSCAYLPRVVQFMLHVHPLTLELSYTTTGFRCVKCHRYSSGFAFVCHLRGWCEYYWVVDTLCASICEPFHHHSHSHPLFVTCGEHETKTCSICQSSEEQPLNCVKCYFVLCFRCATLPHKARYEHDEHLLTFSYQEDASDELYGCEICEEDINPKNGLYVCNECGVTLHIECLLGRDPYVTPGSYWTGVLFNTHSTRPICKTCKRRCPYKIKINSSSTGGPYCSVDCLETDHRVGRGFFI
ncbi:PREDICTED: uncharacterized protein LOC104708996 [Camelina sativa]|uniref:Uncharacterized protein LOC104708996 n=1 Tax=Camelina sativa TaxID=90675 RepID=A0ABM0TC19_CAMSA|nr:PREDICTED: uncharacterized protein LOC104708996 [Camelina sativa]